MSYEQGYALTVQQNLQTDAVATGNGTPMDVQGLSLLAVQVVGITTATILFEGTIDDTNWVTLRSTNYATGSGAGSLTADGIVLVPCVGLLKVRARISAWTAGTINVIARGVSVAPAFAAP